MFQYQAVPPKKHLKLKNVIAVDFDNVIHDPNTASKTKMGTPVAGCKPALDSLANSGYKLVIWTLRGHQKAHVAEWLDFYGIPYHDITNEKPDALVYLDDKAIRFIDWEQALNDIQTLAPLIESLPSVASG